MTSFTYVRSDSIGTGTTGLDGTTVAYAGGTDLLPRIKLGLTTPERLVDLKQSGLSDTIRENGDRVELGALVTLADIEHSPVLAARATALVEAAAQAATPQIRNRATVAGNVLQRPRCWYYRDPEIACWLKGGNHCPARDGRNEHHAIFTDASTCVAVHPSDLASCLVALGAHVDIADGSSTRTLAVEDLFAAPTDDRRTETVLGPADVITSIAIPAPSGLHSTYRKAMDRKAWAFALVGVAAAARVERGAWADARVVLSGVANGPRRADGAERMLRAGTIDAGTIDAAARAVVEGARPLAENRYKLDLAVAMTRDALTALAERSGLSP